MHISSIVTIVYFIECIEMFSELWHQNLIGKQYSDQKSTAESSKFGIGFSKCCEARQSESVQRFTSIG